MTEAIIESRPGGYQVDLEVFSGPMDLLLYLIRKEEVEIYDIPIARITNQYLRYVEMMKTLNLEVAGEFVLMAATLIRIKTRLLLPRDDMELDEPDPREELIMALVEYRKFKEAGDMLRERALEEEKVYVPASPVARTAGSTEFLPATTMYDMLTAFHDVLSTRQHELAHEVNIERIAIEDRIRIIVAAVGARDGITFAQLIADTPRRLVAVVTFIAILELARTRRLRIQQTGLFSEVRVYRGEKFDDPAPEIEEPEVSTSEGQVKAR
ncbi:MAG: segregation/condensation protein A [Candidatus Zixiibacteriota bacterium]|nr:MAG: segregation/condensation protein A [candidate division Zixibacteria bacterium]